MNTTLHNPILKPQEIAVLIGLSALTTVFHLDFLPVWFPLLATVCIGIKWLIEKKYLRPINIFIKLILTGVIVFLIVNQYGRVIGYQAGTALLCSMLCLKILETKTFRDGFMLGIINLFIIMTYLLRNQDILMAVLLYALAFFIVATLFLIKHDYRFSQYKLAFSKTGLMLLQAMPLMVIAFYLFPRLATPFWGIPNDMDEVKTGLGDSMSPGSFTELIIDDSPAFRVTFDDEIPNKNQLYWRGPVLWHFDGTTWHKNQFSTPPAPAKNDFQPLSDYFSYTVTLLPNFRNHYFALDLPTQYPNNLTLTNDYQLLSQRKITNTISYSATSVVNYILSPKITRTEHQVALQLPNNVNPKTLALAQSWQQQLNSPQAIIEQALTLFREEPFVYSYTPPKLGWHSMDEFLFETREGFCEHYSSAFTVLMRAAGIPARVVIGFQGATYNAIGDYYIVRNSDAHAWAEVWLENRGWVRVDPTAAVAPERVNIGIQQALPDRNSWLDYQLIRQARFVFDSLQNLWHQAFTSYSHKQQESLLSWLENDYKFNYLPFIFLITGSLIIAIISYYIYHSGLQTKDKLFVNYQLLLKKINRLGIDTAPHKTPKQLLRAIKNQKNKHYKELAAIINQYIKLKYYVSSLDGKQIKKFSINVKQFKPKINNN